jgi:hypothetical protein
MVSAMRDSTLNYKTYWLQDGFKYGTMRNLGSSDSCAIPADKLSKIPEPDRTILLDEVKGNPAFCAKIVKCMETRPDWAHRISTAAKESIVNEMDPTKFPERKGDWPKLRERVREMADFVHKEVSRAADALTLPEKIQVVKKIARGDIQVKGLSGLGDLGQWDILASLAGSLISAGSSVYGAKVTADAQQDIAKINATAAMQNAQAQMAIANANAAIASAQTQISSPISSTISSLTTSTVAGIPVIIPVLGAVGFALWFAFKKK